MFLEIKAWKASDRKVNLKDKFICIWIHELFDKIVGSELYQECQVFIGKGIVTSALSWLESYSNNMICAPLYLWTDAVVPVLSGWLFPALKLGKRNVNTAQNFSWCYTVTAIFADRIAGIILQVEVLRAFHLWE